MLISEGDFLLRCEQPLRAFFAGVKHICLSMRVYDKISKYVSASDPRMLFGMRLHVTVAVPHSPMNHPSIASWLYVVDDVFSELKDMLSEACT